MIDLGVDGDEHVEFGGPLHSGAQCRESALGKSSMPLCDMNACSPITPQACSSSMRSRLPGTSPPQSAKSTNDSRSATLAFGVKRCGVDHGRVEFSGMSKNVVVPPAAQAREPVAMPSQSARPGSLKCTCASITPGERAAAASIPRVRSLR
jgi:hypothetical protein